MWTTITLCVAAISIILFSPMNTFAFKSQVSAGVTYLTGETKYSIGNSYYGPGDTGAGAMPFPISVLEFPLDSFMGSLRGSLNFSEKWLVELNVKKNFTSGDDKMKDSDYLTDFVEEGTNNLIHSGPGFPPDVYSESDVDLDSLSLDLNLRYNLVKGLYAGAGYIYQNHDYDVSNARQWYPLLDYFALWDSYWYTPGDYLGGVGLTYEITYHIPYLELFAKGKIQDRLHIEGSFRYSPITNAQDEDHHIHRSLYSEGDCDGDTYMLSLKLRYDWKTNWFFNFQADYMSVSTDGETITYSEGEWDHTIYNEIESTQTGLTFEVGYAF